MRSADLENHTSILVFDYQRHCYELCLIEFLCLRHSVSIRSKMFMPAGPLYVLGEENIMRIKGSTLLRDAARTLSQIYASTSLN